MVKKDLMSWALSRLWNDRCTIWAKEGVVNPESGRMESVEKVLVENAPCKISYAGSQPLSRSRSSASQRIKTSLQNLGASVVKSEVKLFLAADTPVPPGSRIAVTRNGIETIYHLSGVPAVYSSHMEIPLRLEQEWA